MRRFGLFPLLCLLAFSPAPVSAQGTVPTFTHTVGQASYTLAGRDPAEAQTTDIPTVVVPIKLTLEAGKRPGQPAVMDASADVASLLSSPVFSKYVFSPGNETQYADAMLRATFPKADTWHTLL